MNFLETVMDKWKIFVEKATPVLESVKQVCKDVGAVFCKIGKYIYKMRKIFLAVPVAWAAISLAIYNEASLPPVVGLDLQINGDFGLQIIRELAVLGPVVITAVCLLLMFASRRLLTPWLVSVFTLLLPLFIRLINTFPS
ncbi:MAG: hypothetical protein E7439_06965 [Ruminococcaceae bacterium]|nr:hypothetical protein [Oscillospiraceae bacterium]